MVDFMHAAIRSGFKADPDIPLQIEPCRHVAELARKKALGVWIDQWCKFQMNLRYGLHAYLYTSYRHWLGKFGMHAYAAKKIQNLDSSCGATIYTCYSWCSADNWPPSRVMILRGMELLPTAVMLASCIGAVIVDICKTSCKEPVVWKGNMHGNPRLSPWGPSLYIRSQPLAKVN